MYLPAMSHSYNLKELTQRSNTSVKILKMQRFASRDNNELIKQNYREFSLKPNMRLSDQEDTTNSEQTWNKKNIYISKRV